MDRNLHAAADGVAWRLPGGTEVSGTRLYGQFVRRGEFEIRVRRADDEEALPVIIE